MHYDPLTVVIAPSQDGTAVGTLYLDDEASLAHETAGAFSYRRFRFENNVLTCESASPLSEKSTYRPPNTVERVEIANQKTAPKRVLYRSNSLTNTQPGVELMAFHDTDRHVLIVKKPDGNVGDDWSLTLEF